MGGRWGKLRGRIIKINSKIGATELASDEYPTVLMYHSIGVDGGANNITPSEFRSHIDWLSSNYNITSLRNLIEGPFGEKKKVAITFDDALLSFYDQAKPILREYSAPATVFVISSSIESSNMISNKELLHDRLDTTDELMTKEQLEELTQEPLISIGAHTETHPVLTEINEPERLKKEIIGAKETIESELGISINTFCYPYNEWNAKTHSLVNEVYEYAVQDGGCSTYITPNTNRHLIPRINAGVELDQLKYEIPDLAKGIERWYIRIWKRDNIRKTIEKNDKCLQ